MSKSSSTSAGSGGLGVFSVLGIIFITLKLCGVIHWSWLWVLAPFWIPLSLCVVVFFIGCLIVGVCQGLILAIEYRQRNFERRKR
jgi:hypothetical protein